MNYTVEIRHSVGYESFKAGEGIIPHTFLVVTDAAGIEHGYGFAPEETGLYGSGAIHDDTETKFDSSVKFTITETQYNTLM